MREDLLRYVRRRAGRLLVREDAEDLVQSILARALEGGKGCRFGSREEFLGWLYAVAASHLADRHAYWAALRRSPGRLLRLTRAGSTTGDPAAVPEPAHPGAGPGTRAGLGEEARRAARALEFILPRDRALVEWLVADVPLEEQAKRLGIAGAAARQARHRALRRFRDAFAALSRGRSSRTH
jgi:DNA-directed RNA polymerase specialized sigma24 family protein